MFTGHVYGDPLAVAFYCSNKVISRLPCAIREEVLVVLVGGEKCPLERDKTESETEERSGRAAPEIFLFAWRNT